MWQLLLVFLLYLLLGRVLRTSVQYRHYIGMRIFPLLDPCLAWARCAFLSLICSMFSLVVSMYTLLCFSCIQRECVPRFLFCHMRRTSCSATPVFSCLQSSFRTL